MEPPKYWFEAEAVECDESGEGDWAPSKTESARSGGVGGSRTLGVAHGGLTERQHPVLHRRRLLSIRSPHFTRLLFCRHLGCWATVSRGTCAGCRPCLRES